MNPPQGMREADIVEGATVVVDQRDAIDFDGLDERRAGDSVRLIDQPTADGEEGVDPLHGSPRGKKAAEEFRKREQREGDGNIKRLERGEGADGDRAGESQPGAEHRGSGPGRTRMPRTAACSMSARR